MGRYVLRSIGEMYWLIVKAIITESPFIADSRIVTESGRLNYFNH